MLYPLKCTNTAHWLGITSKPSFPCFVNNRRMRGKRLNHFKLFIIDLQQVVVEYLPCHNQHIVSGTTSAGAVRKLRPGNGNYGTQCVATHF